jgi:protein-disulfide isomerase
MSEENQKSDAGSGVITIQKDALWKYSSIVLGLIVVIMAVAMFTGGNGVTGNVVAPTNPSAPSAPVDVDADDDAILGDPNAKVTIIEFSDYQCPFCARFWSDTLPLIKKEYIDTGKVNLVFRDFPLNSIHPLAQPAAEATECVREQGGDEAFYEMHDQIFANQHSLSNANLINWAKTIGYDIQSCLSSGKYAQEVNDDLQDGAGAGIRGTPGFVINGQVISGAQPFSVFKQIIDANL